MKKKIMMFSYLIEKELEVVVEVQVEKEMMTEDIRKTKKKSIRKKSIRKKSIKKTSTKKISTKKTSTTRKSVVEKQQQQI